MAKKGKSNKSVSKSKSKSVSKSVKSVKSKALAKPTTKKSVPAKKSKSTKAKSFSLPKTSELPPVGDLPELPNFEDISDHNQNSQPTESALVQDAMAQTSPSQSEKPKLWWLSWLLPGKKHAVVDAQSVDVTALEAADTLTEEESAQLAQMPSAEELNEVLTSETNAVAKLTPAQAKKAKKKQAQQEEHITRAYDEVDTLKTRLDNEMRERQSVVEESHARVQMKEAELEKWHSDLLSREKEIVSKEKEYTRIKKLEAQVEDKEITLKYKEEEIEDLKNKLAEKELELTQQEDKLKKMSQRLESQQIARQTEAAQVQHVSDDYHKLAKKHGHVVHQKVEPKTVLSKVVSSTDLPSKREIRNLLLRAYDQLSVGDMAGLQFTYNKIRDSYARMIATAGPDDQLYKDILDLYSDIKLAVMQRN